MQYSFNNGVSIRLVKNSFNIHLVVFFGKGLLIRSELCSNGDKDDKLTSQVDLLVHVQSTKIIRTVGSYTMVNDDSDEAV